MFKPYWTDYRLPLKGSLSSLVVNLSSNISCLSCSRLYFFMVASFSPTLLTEYPSAQKCLFPNLRYVSKIRLGFGFHTWSFASEIRHLIGILRGRICLQWRCIAREIRRWICPQWRSIVTHIQLHDCRICTYTLYFRFPCFSKIIFADFPFKYPIKLETQYFGGILNSWCTWSGIICPSKISTPFHFHKSRMYGCISARSWLLMIFLRYFRLITMWYLHTHFECAKLSAIQQHLSFSILTPWILVIISGLVLLLLKLPIPPT